jgi:hypothetical protein
MRAREPSGARTSAAIVAVAGLALLAAASVPAARAARAARDLPQADRRAATAAVQSFLTLSAHLRGSGGDPRFAERLPASEAVVGELMDEIAYLRHAGRLDEPRLVRSEIREVKPEADGLAAVRTKEYWITRDVREGGEVRSDVVLARYTLARDGAAWRVVDWSVDPDRPSGDAPAAGGR